MIAVNDYVIIRKDHPESSRNGIILPYVKDLVNNEIGAPFTGTVESAGELVKLVKEKDKVVFNDLSRPWIIADKEDLLLVMKETDIIGILSNGN